MPGDYNDNIQYTGKPHLITDQAYEALSPEADQKRHDSLVPATPKTDEFGLPVRQYKSWRCSVESCDSLWTLSDKVDEVQEAGDLPCQDEQTEGISQPDPVEKGREPAGSEQSCEYREHTPEEHKSRDHEQCFNSQTYAPEKVVELKQQLESPQVLRAPSNDECTISSKKHKYTNSAISEWSHQQLAPPVDHDGTDANKEDEWQEMPVLATHRIYDDWGKVLADAYSEANDERITEDDLGGAGHGYTRVTVDEDAQSATSMDDKTAYLFHDPYMTTDLQEEEAESKDLVQQMQSTKELLTEAQRIAYVSVVKLSVGQMLHEYDSLDKTRSTRKHVEYAVEHMKMWGQTIMMRLYRHMQVDAEEQVMIEQLAEHGVSPADLTPTLLQNRRVKNPSQRESGVASTLSPTTPFSPPPAYEEHTANQLTIEDAAHFEDLKYLDLDIRWTILCDLFLLLVADSYYDARSRTVFELVGDTLGVTWQELCRFEKRVTDALDMQDQAKKETWNEDEHLEARRKAASRKRLMVMGLCTAGGGLLIGLSAGLLAPVIGAGLAAGFTAVGVTGTSTFLGGAGAAALIGGVGTATGGIIGVRASNRRTGAVKTFEYRPLHNNKRTNLIVTVGGWMAGKLDDVRLPFSTVDPIMGDVYGVHWEPEMLQSTGQTISILRSEALTQTIQQILGATFLTTLMAGLTLPLVLTKLSYLIDNPWTVSLARADATGLILADSLIDRHLGVRPITLVGFSLGSRVIFACLRELARRGALGLVQNVYMFGSPIVAKQEEYVRARTVVAGRFVNGYATHDWILGYLFRATSGGLGQVSGLSAVEVPGIENKDVSSLVPGHMAYRGMMPFLLREVGWVVTSLEFTEIEDPDPENHEKRQRELIREFDAARVELEAKAQKKSPLTAIFSRRKSTGKKVWEIYDERRQKVLEGDEKEAATMAEEKIDSIYDIDAIWQEAMKLAVHEGADPEEVSQRWQIREIPSSIPST